MITAQLATIPERIEILPQVIDSLLPQVDRLNVMLNGYDSKETYHIMHEYSLDYSCMSCDDLYKIHFINRQNQMADGEKYYNIENAEGYIFTCDDDILYPPDYVEYMISKIEQYERKAVISLHGRRWGSLPIASFYRDRLNDLKDVQGAGMFRALSAVKGDHVILDNVRARAGCCGDGVAAWHSDTLKMRYDLVELPNMAQTWLALACNAQYVKQIVVEHEEGYVQQLWEGKGLWDSQCYNDKIQTNLINTRWK